MTEKEMRRLSLLAEVACDYYERGLDQTEIAGRLFLSRTRVSRLLKEARERGIVSISVNYHSNEYPRHYELEERFLDRFPLKHARILNNRGRDLSRLQQDVGRLAAEYVMEHLKKDMIIGTSWGTTLRDTMDALCPADTPVDVVQLMGSVPCRTPNCTPQAIVAGIADRFHGHADFLNMPLFIADDYVRRQLCEDRNNKKILQKGIFSDMILTGISDAGQIGEQDLWLGYMTPQMYRELKEKGAVGAMFAQFYDSEGKEIDCTWNRRCVGISLAHIREVPDVVGIAGSVSKAPAILAAVRGGLVDTLVTDGTTATAVLNML